MISWFTRNGIAANFLMVGIFLAGSYAAFFKIPLEVTPALSWNLVMMDMRYRGATPKDIEKAILIPVETALERVQGIEQLNADGGNNAQYYDQTGIYLDGPLVLRIEIADQSCA